MACNHGECAKEKKNEKVEIILYAISVVLFVLGFLPVGFWAKMLLYLASVLVAGYDLLLEGIKNLFKLDFEEDTLMTIAVIAAFILGEFPESCLVILLFKLGEFIEDKAEEKSHANIEEIVKIKANVANKMLGSKIEVVPVNQIKVGDRILIKAGEKVPVDCEIIKGNAQLDTSPITGESKPRQGKVGDEILSGFINLNGAIECKVLHDEKNSTASQIIDLVYEATNNKGKTEKFITKFSKIYTPTVIIIAIGIAVIPRMLGLDWKTWIMRALFFLVASCPCSLVISVPLAFFSCVGAISKKGMIVKGTKHVEDLAKATGVALDKTGTLTTGKMVIDRVKTYGNFSQTEVLMYMASMEALSNHPIATAIEKMATEVAKKSVEEYKEIAGHGLYGIIEGKEVLVGNRKLLEKYEIAIKEEIEDGIILCIDKEVAGIISLKEEIRKEAEDFVGKMKKQGVARIAMLTGDSKKQAEKVAKELEIKEVYAELLPQDKLKIVEQMKKEGGKLLFIGDGINDSPVLAASDFGIAMGTGAEIAGSTADSILISNDIGIIPVIMQIAKKSMRIIKFNITFSLVIKMIVLILGILGIAPVWMAVLADTGVTLLTVLNAIRIFGKK